MKVKFVLKWLLIVLMFIQCKSKQSEMTHSLEEVRTIFNQDKQEIIDIYQSNGAGIGKDSGRYVIVVYVSDNSPGDSIQKFWKGIPLKFEDIGEVKAQ